MPCDKASVADKTVSPDVNNLYFTSDTQTKQQRRLAHLVSAEDVLVGTRSETVECQVRLHLA